jgi:short-subunit dehydrogenase
MFLVGFIKFVGFLGLLRFIWWVFKILVAYFRKPVQLDRSKWVLITGASTGVGQALALKCAQQGVNVVGIGPNESALQSVQIEYSRLHPSGTFRYILRDFSDPTAAADIFSELQDIELSSLFVCHGRAVRHKLIDWTNKELIDYNNALMTSNVLLAKHFAAKSGQQGNITFISSPNTFTYGSISQNYGSVKRFLNQFVHSYQFEAGKMCVQVLNANKVDQWNIYDCVSSNEPQLFCDLYDRSLKPERVADMVLATLNTNFDVDVGYDSIIGRVLFWVLPPPIIDFLIRKSIAKRGED